MSTYYDFRNLKKTKQKNHKKHDPPEDVNSQNTATLQMVKCLKIWESAFLDTRNRLAKLRVSEQTSI